MAVTNVTESIHTFLLNKPPCPAHGILHAVSFMCKFVSQFEDETEYKNQYTQTVPCHQQCSRLIDNQPKSALKGIIFLHQSGACAINGHEQ